MTTTALALAGWLRDALLVEADLCGGVLALRYGLGREPGLLSLAADRKAAEGNLLGHAQALPGPVPVPVLVGPESAMQALMLWRRAGAHLLRVLVAYDGPVLIDVGRLGHGESHAGLLTSPSLVVIVVRRRAEELVAAAQRIEALGCPERRPRDSRRRPVPHI